MDKIKNRIILLLNLDKDFRTYNLFYSFRKTRRAVTSKKRQINYYEENFDFYDDGSLKQILLKETDHLKSLLQIIDEEFLSFKLFNSEECYIIETNLVVSKLYNVSKIKTSHAVEVSYNDWQKNNSRKIIMYPDPAGQN